MRIVIVGASGLVGGNCLRLWQQQHPDWALLGTHYGYAAPATRYYNTLDPADPRNADLAAFAPDWIVHCGALTHVDYCEQHPAESEAQTLGSTRQLLALAARLNARLAYFSTDYVFDGAHGPYLETDAPAPLNVYGRHKLAAEQAVHAAHPGNLVLRITNVYGDEAREKNFVARLLQQLRSGEPHTLRLPYDQFATPVGAHDVAAALALLLRDGHSGTWHLAGTEYLSRVQLAHQLADLVPQHRVTIQPLATAELHQPAPRPLLGGLQARKFLARYPHFRFRTTADYVRSVLQRPAA